MLQTMLLYTVYKTTNKVNGKYYIGCHETTNPNDGYYGSGNLIVHALKKYGKDAFYKEVLFVFANREDMMAKEHELVDHKDPMSYNLAPGGAHAPSISMPSQKGKKKSALHTQRMIATKTGMKYTESHCRNIGLASKGRKMPPRSQEYRDKISASRIGIPMSDVTKKRLSIAKTGKTMPPRTPEHLENLCKGRERVKLKRELEKLFGIPFAYTDFRYEHTLYSLA